MEEGVRAEEKLNNKIQITVTVTITWHHIKQTHTLQASLVRTVRVRTQYLPLGLYLDQGIRGSSPISCNISGYVSHS